MKEIKDYVWEEKKDGKSWFHLFSIDGHAGTGSNSLKEIARLIEELYVDSPDFFYERITLYSSIDENIEGKPYLVATREEVTVNGDDDLLSKIQEEMIKILKKRKQKGFEVDPLFDYDPIPDGF